MAQGPSANPEKFSPPGPWGAAPDPRVGAAVGAVTPTVDVPFLPTATAVYALTLESSVVLPPFIASATSVHAPDLTGSGSIAFDSSTTWICPDGVYVIHVDVWGGGGAGSASGANQGDGGGGAGAYAGNPLVPVTPGNTYTITVGAGGATSGASGPTSTFVGDSSTTVQAVGGTGGSGTSAGTGGAAGSSTGTTKHSGGNGGAGSSQATSGGGGGGEAGGTSANGNPGVASLGGSTTQQGSAGGSGAGDGGDGGRAGDAFSQPGRIDAQPGAAPGGAGGGGGAFIGTVGTGAGGRVRISFVPHLFPPFIASSTVVYAPTLVGDELHVPFIASSTVVYAIAAIWQASTGAGNGGETFPVQLAPNGSTVTATLAGVIGPGATNLVLTGDSGLPSSGSFLLTIDDEVLYVTVTSAHNYRVGARALSNTVAAGHADGSTVSWNDTYDLAVASQANIAKTFVYSVDGVTYDAWLIAFDSSQAYSGPDRYAIHVVEFVGIYPPGSSTSKLDGPQASASHVPDGVTDDCPAALTVPARLIDNVVIGDVALLRYTNPDGSILELGPRSVLVQSWYAFSRRDAANVDVTTTDPTGTVVDAAVDVEAFNVDEITTTMPGGDRTFTHGGSPSPPNFADKGWPIAALAIRQGTKRVPRWTSPDWHDFSYVYTGFGVDATFVQVLINRNGLTYAGVVEESVNLPNSSDITGPNATWDDPAYRSSAAWSVDIFAGAVLFVGPPANGPPPSELPPPILPGISPGGSGDGGGTGPPFTPPPPPPLEGGSGGDIPPPPTVTAGERVWTALV